MKPSKIKIPRSEFHKPTRAFENKKKKKDIDDNDGWKDDDNEVINWDHIRYLMGKSIRGRSLSSDESKEIQEAFNADSETYGQLHDKEKDCATEELNPLYHKK